MNKIILLLAVLAALVGAVIYQQKDRKSRLSSGARKGVEMRELLLPALDVNSVQKIRVKDEKSEVNVALNGTTWTVAERGGYEASFDKISRALLALKEIEKMGAPQGGDLAARLDGLIDHLLAPLEKQLVAGFSHPRLPVLFLVGNPRSGSTVFMQFLQSTGAFAVPTNVLSRFYYAPCIGAKIQQLLFNF